MAALGDLQRGVGTACGVPVRAKRTDQAGTTRLRLSRAMPGPRGQPVGWHGTARLATVPKRAVPNQAGPNRARAMSGTAGSLFGHRYLDGSKHI